MLQTISLPDSARVIVLPDSGCTLRIGSPLAHTQVTHRGLYLERQYATDLHLLDVAREVDAQRLIEAVSQYEHVRLHDQSEPLVVRGTDSSSYLAFDYFTEPGRAQEQWLEYPHN